MPKMMVGDIAVEVTLKRVKNVNLSVHAPTGAVRISAPSRMRLDTIHTFAISRVDWIKRQQTRMRARTVPVATPASALNPRVEARYRDEIRLLALSLIASWEPLMGVRVARLHVRRMKTRWGSCNYRARSIRLNTELARKPRECLEYVIVHELVHLLEPSHNARFKSLMDRFMPQWRVYRDMLNRVPVTPAESRAE